MADQERPVATSVSPTLVLVVMLRVSANVSIIFVFAYNSLTHLFLTLYKLYLRIRVKNKHVLKL